MWQERHRALVERRDLLQAHSALLREQLAQDAQALEHPLALADRVHAGLRWVKARPYWLAVLAAVPAVLRPRRALSWTLRLWTGWRLWRRVAALRG